MFVIDEWDAPLRECRSKSQEEGWVYFLRLHFKNATFTPKVVTACYMTGILPIIRYGMQSALSDFRGYTFLSSGAYAPYVGITEADVEMLAVHSCMDMGELRRAYDGYGLRYVDSDSRKRCVVRSFAPFSVACACERGEVGLYWVTSSAFRSLLFYVDLDFDGLQQAIVQAVGGSSVALSASKFSNDQGCRPDGLRIRQLREPQGDRHAQTPREDAERMADEGKRPQNPVQHGQGEDGKCRLVTHRNR